MLIPAIDSTVFVTQKKRAAEIEKLLGVAFSIDFVPGTCSENDPSERDHLFLATRSVAESCDEDLSFTAYADDRKGPLGPQFAAAMREKISELEKLVEKLEELPL
jgi:hypothetical protein